MNVLIECIDWVSIACNQCIDWMIECIPSFQSFTRFNRSIVSIVSIVQSFNRSIVSIMFNHVQSCSIVSIVSIMFNHVQSFTSLLVQITKKNMFYNVYWKCLLYCVRHIQTENGVHIQTENDVHIQTENDVHQDWKRCAHQNWKRCASKLKMVCKNPTGGPQLRNVMFKKFKKLQLLFRIGSGNFSYWSRWVCFWKRSARWASCWARLSSTNRSFTTK